jgi:8-oxo-dGTP pyrophosphatase MutT (NUDIX family)
VTDSPRNFRFRRRRTLDIHGEMELRCRLLVDGSFVEGAVTAALAPHARPTTPALEANIERRWRAELAEAAREKRHLFDGPVLRWIDHEVRRAEGGASFLSLVLGRSSYREFVGTNLDATLRPDVAGGALPWSCFGNAVGTSAIVIARDGPLVAGRRSRRVTGYAGFVHTFGGMLEGVDERARADGVAIDVFASMRRELTEELGLAPAEMRALRLNGVMLEPLIHQPELLFDLSVPLTSSELRERWRSATSGDEHDELVLLPDDERAIESALARLGPVSPIGRACLALHFNSRTSQERRRAPPSA